MAFQASPSYLYTINSKLCNENDLLVAVCRVIRQAGNAGVEIARVIHDDVISVLQYKAYWQRDKYSESILKVVSPPHNVREKSFSCPWF